jgi:hypothetical protein
VAESPWLIDLLDGAGGANFEDIKEDLDDVK